MLAAHCGNQKMLDHIFMRRARVAWAYGPVSRFAILALHKSTVASVAMRGRKQQTPLAETVAVWPLPPFAKLKLVAVT